MSFFFFLRKKTCDLSPLRAGDVSPTTAQLIIKSPLWWSKNHKGRIFGLKSILIQMYLINTIKAFLNHLLTFKYSKITKEHQNQLNLKSPNKICCEFEVSHLLYILVFYLLILYIYYNLKSNSFK
jgi:hypothetical protein